MSSQHCSRATAHLPRDPPHGGMIEEHRLDHRLQQVHEIVVTPHVRELVRENRFELLGLRPASTAAGTSTTGLTCPNTTGAVTRDDTENATGRAMRIRAISARHPLTQSGAAPTPRVAARAYATSRPRGARTAASRRSPSADQPGQRPRRRMTAARPSPAHRSPPTRPSVRAARVTRRESARCRAARPGVLADARRATGARERLAAG